ncbi:unnamed protein product [Durusdinium trenchii]|uniref:Uncharacterized protein n=1 Tax=Durusdinium trenchii TaxID=1381693 RepID=A0ABP0PQN3_9DINO
MKGLMGAAKGALLGGSNGPPPVGEAWWPPPDKPPLLPPPISPYFQGQPASRASLGASSQLDNEGEANAPQVPFVASDRSVRFAMPGAESSVRIRSLLVNMFQELDSIQSLWAFGPGLEVGS